MSSQTINVSNIIGQEKILNTKVTLAAGDDQAIAGLEADATKRYQIVCIEISCDIAGITQIHRNVLANIATNQLAGGFLPDSGGLIKFTGGMGKITAANEAVLASIVTSTAVEISIDYIERPAAA